MSYAIGDESDDEFESFNRRGHQLQPHQLQPASSSSSSANPLGGPVIQQQRQQRVSQPHQYVDDDPFEDAPLHGDHAATSRSTAAAGAAAAGRLSIDDGDALLDFTGGQSANPQGTASDTRHGPGLYGGMGGNNSRYDVYEE